ncbi:MAG TPA: histidine kinase [Blastocatellia bacterium]
MLETRSKRNNNSVYGLLFIAAWTIIGLISTGQLYTASYLEGDRIVWWRALVWQMSPWYIWVLLTPIVRHFGKKYRITARHWVRPALHHLMLSILLSLFGLLILISIRCLVPIDPARPYSFATLAVKLTGASYHINLLIYWMILGVGYAFDYQRQVRERESLALSLEKQLAQAQLQALRMQIQPHFLFNTLNAITVLVRDQRNQAAVRMLTGLGELLRVVLSQSNTPMVTLQEEVEFIHKYLEIEQTRFADRLKVSIDLAPETLPALVPSFILQPLVENAVKHGISQIPGAGLIEIRARSNNGKLLLCVQNNGPELSEPEPFAQPGGIGISNIRARLEKLYGAEHQFTIGNAESFGVVATLSIPLNSAVNHD